MQTSKAEPTLDKPVESYTLKKYIWRPYVTPFETILNHRYPGSGTEADPYIVDWIHGEAEDPQMWNTVYKWLTSECNRNNAGNTTLTESRRRRCSHDGRRPV